MRSKRCASSSCLSNRALSSSSLTGTLLPSTRPSSPCRCCTSARLSLCTNRRGAVARHAGHRNRVRQRPVRAAGPGPASERKEGSFSSRAYLREKGRIHSCPSLYVCGHIRIVAEETGNDFRRSPLLVGKTAQNPLGIAGRREQGRDAAGIPCGLVVIPDQDLPRLGGGADVVATDHSTVSGST